MNPKLLQFIQEKNKGITVKKEIQKVEGFPCIDITYKDWKNLVNPSDKILYMIKDFPSSYDISIGNFNSESSLGPAGKIFKGASECMRKIGEDLIDVLLRHGWNYITQIYSNDNFRDITIDYPDEVTEPDDKKDDYGPDSIVEYFNSFDEFPKTGTSKCLYFDGTTETLYHWSKELKTYKPISELLGKVIIDASEE